MVSIMLAPRWLDNAPEMPGAVPRNVGCRGDQGPGSRCPRNTSSRPPVGRGVRFPGTSPQSIIRQPDPDCAPQAQLPGALDSGLHPEEDHGGSGRLPLCSPLDNPGATQGKSNRRAFSKVKPHRDLRRQGGAAECGACSARAGRGQRKPFLPDAEGGLLQRLAWLSFHCVSLRFISLHGFVAGGVSDTCNETNPAAGGVMATRVRALASLSPLPSLGCQGQGLVDGVPQLMHAERLP
jgi:hypothetical protein